MKNKVLGIFGVVFVLMAAIAVSAQGDFKMRQRMTAAGQTSESTVMIKGARERTESESRGMKSVTIIECDLKRTVRINEIEKKYMIEPMVTDAPSVAPSTTTTTTKVKTQKGGLVTRTIEIIDTGERKQMFGLTARHIKTIMTTDPSPGACEKDKQRVETDGWYVDLNVNFACKTERPIEPPVQHERSRGGCIDQNKIVQKGGGKLGYALSVTSKIGMPGMDGADEDAETAAMMAKMGVSGGMMSTTTEIVELSRATLPQSLFEIPAGYTEVTDMKDLYGGMATQKAVGEYNRNNASSMMPDMTAKPAGAKKPGVIRVGVMAFSNSTGKQLNTDGYRSMLVSQISSDKVEAVAVSSETDAQAKGCDYILTSDIRSLKQSAASKIGGMFGKVTGAPTSGGKVESVVAYSLKGLASTASASLQSEATAKVDGEDMSIMSAVSSEAQAVMKAVKK